MPPSESALWGMNATLFRRWGMVQDLVGPGVGDLSWAGLPVVTRATPLVRASPGASVAEAPEP